MEKTNPNLRYLFIYQIYVRNYSKAGTFQAVIDDLERIRNLGIDMIYLLPIHTIGELNRKGSLGSPYSIKDYLEINPELGTINDFQRLIEATHDMKMKLMIDIVFNHTSRDSRLLKDHPEWFYRNEKNEPANRVGDWWDVVDLDYSSDKALWDELIETLMVYADMGVDGFRADVASIVPLDFWRQARKVISKERRDIIWLSESVHGPFVKEIRDRGFDCASESEIYQVFDMAYDYDVRPFLDGYLDKKISLRNYQEAILAQEWTYPKNYVKLRNIENHDTRRIADWLDGDLDRIMNHTAFMFFQKGATMIYNGQEFLAKHRLSLFEKEQIDKNGDISTFIMKLAKLKKSKLFVSGVYKVIFPETEDVAGISYEDDSLLVIGIFNLGGVTGAIKIGLPDGKYRNYLDGKIMTVKNGMIGLAKEPVILRIQK